jgi:GNAT superfamily N-acetyltransferase
MLDIRPATTDEDLGHIVGIISIVAPDDPTSVAEMRWSETAYPGGRRFLAWLDGEPVGSGGVGRIYVYAEDYPALWGSIAVLPDHRRKGVGGALLAVLAEAARAAGKPTLVGRTTSDRTESMAFLEHRGFVEHERMKAVRLDLETIEIPTIDPPAGVEITSLAARPDLIEGVYAVALEALPDIPGEGPMVPGSLAEFRVRDVDRDVVPAGGFAVGLDATTGTVVGYANLMLVPGNPTIAWHGMTAVARAWRGRGVASAMKRATIAWAAANGIEALETANDTDNVPMRAVNRALGYQPLPDEIYYRGSVGPA